MYVIMYVIMYAVYVIMYILTSFFRLLHAWQAYAVMDERSRWQSTLRQKNISSFFQLLRCFKITTDFYQEDYCIQTVRSILNAPYKIVMNITEEVR